jgi:hypothetical protein
MFIVVGGFGVGLSRRGFSAGGRGLAASVMAVFITVSAALTISVAISIPVPVAVAVSITMAIFAVPISLSVSVPVPLTIPIAVLPVAVLLPVPLPLSVPIIVPITMRPVRLAPVLVPILVLVPVPLPALLRVALLAAAPVTPPLTVLTGRRGRSVATVLLLLVPPGLGLALLGAVRRVLPAVRRPVVVMVPALVAAVSLLVLGRRVRPLPPAAPVLLAIVAAAAA